MRQGRVLLAQWFTRGKWQHGKFHIDLVPLRKLLLDEVGVKLGKAEQKKLAELGVDI